MFEFSEKEFDVIGFAKKIMREIDAIRSFDRIADKNTETGERTPSESRVNAFFRLIGLPMFVSVYETEGEKVKKLDDIKFLSPGFSKSISSNFANKKIDNTNDKYDSINEESKPIWEILNDREVNLQIISEKVGTNDMNDRMLKSLFSPIDIKPNIPAKLIGEGDFFPKSQPRGGADTENVRKVFKKLFPLITSSREILPLNNLIARPFTLSERERVIDRETTLRKPFLEEVIRIRFVEYGSSQKEKEKQKNQDLENSVKQLIGEEEYNNIFQKTFSKINILEEFVINKFLYAIKNLARYWVKLNEKDRAGILREVNPNISIKTGSARSSIFGKRIELSSVIDGTKNGEKLNKLNKLISEEELLIALFPSDENEDKEEKKSQTRNITPSALHSAFSEILNFNLDKNKNEKNELLETTKRNIKRLEKIRLELDSMTGEFIGLSLPDIIMVMAGLFIIDRDELLNLLDKYTIDNMKNDKTLKPIVQNVSPSSSKAMSAIQSLEFVVGQLFSFFQREVELINNRKNRGKEKKQRTE